VKLCAGIFFAILIPAALWYVRAIFGRWPK
jgi:hypothetical protein